MRRAGRIVRRLTASVRVRVALLAGLAFAITMVAASLVLLRALESRLVSSIRSNDSSALQAQAIQVLTTGIPTQVPADHVITIDNGGAVAFTVSAPGQQAIVAAANGQLVSPTVTGGATGGATQVIDSVGPPAGLPTVFDQMIPSRAAEYSSGAALPIDDRSASLLGVSGDTGPVLLSSVEVYPGLSLFTASSLAQVDDTLSATRTILWYVVPALVLLVAGFAWLLVGRALRPVHSLTDRAATITSRSLHERVPVSATGDEVSELATTINSMLDRIETADIASRRLVSDASHELRTPIAVMRTELEVARRDPSAVWADVSSTVLGEVDRLQALVDDLLLVARMSERGGATFSEFSLLDTVREVGARRRGIDVTVSGEGVDTDTDVTMVGDGDAVRRAVDHVVANAARHATTSVEVTIDAAPAGGPITIHVDDDGPGIAVADRDRVLERFERLDEGRSRDAGGSGLGLSVALDVMAAHGGTVTIGDAPIGGARVSLSMPRAPHFETEATVAH